MTLFRKMFLCVAAAAMLAGTPRAEAHHAFAAEFDAKQPITLRGTVTKVEWINPHTWIHIDVKDTDGSVVEWMIEGGTPNTLLRAGVDRKSLPAGTGDPRRWLPREERAQSRERPRHHPRLMDASCRWDRRCRARAGGDTPTDKK